MWLAGALGLACGAGFYTIATMAGVLTLIILSLVRYLERISTGAAKEQESKPNRG